MQRIALFFLVCPMLFPVQEGLSQSGGRALVKGKVLDSLSAAPLSFASIRIFDTAEKKLVNGNITGESGEFSVALPYGRY